MFSPKKLSRKRKGDRPLTSQGHPHAVFQRAVRGGHLALALATAAELQPLSLEDAFELTLLFAALEPSRYGRAAARWQARYVIERGPVELADANLLGALLAALVLQPRTSSRPLAAWFEQRGQRRLAEAITRWTVEVQPTRQLPPPRTTSPAKQDAPGLDQE